MFTNDLSVRVEALESYVLGLSCVVEFLCKQHNISSESITVDEKNMEQMSDAYDELIRVVVVRSDEIREANVTARFGPN